jgi:antiviral helicase SKI2
MVGLAVMVPWSNDASCLPLLDVDVQAVPPHWPPSAQDLVVEDGVYELTDVPITSIALVTNRTLKVMRLFNLV